MMKDPAPFARSLLIALLLLGAAQPHTSHAAVVLVEQARAQARIVVSEEAPDHHHDAAALIGTYVRKISGAELPVVHEPSNQAGLTHIWIGAHPELEQYVAAAELSFEASEEIYVHIEEGHVVIAGRDREHAGRDVEIGTMLAAQVFVREFLDVRWLWPGELGTDVIESSTIELPTTTYRYAPPLGYRQIRAVTHERHWRALDRPRIPGVEVEFWLRDMDRQVRQWLNRHGLDHPPPGESAKAFRGPLDFRANHYFVDWHRQYARQHPDWFALQPDGSRGTFPTNQRNVKLCISNPQVREQYVREALAYFHEHPDRSIISASPNDRGWEGYCVCDACRAWDPDDAPILERPLRWADRTEEHVALTDRYARFWNLISEDLHDELPDREVGIGVWAYHAQRPAPVEVQLNDNIHVGFVGIFRRDRERNSAEHLAEQKQKWQQWSQATDQLIWRPNILISNPGMPYIFTERYAQTIDFLAAHGLRGVDMDSFGNHWATMGPQYYVMARLVWDPSLEIDELLEDYYQRAYGPAAEPMQRYFALFEQLQYYLADHFDQWHRHRDLPTLHRALRTTGQDVGPWQAYFQLGEQAAAPPAKLIETRARGELDLALALADEHEDPRYRQRVAYAEKGFAFVQAQLDVIEGVRQHRAQDNAAGVDPELVEAIMRRAELAAANMDNFALGFLQLESVMHDRGRFYGPSPLWLIEHGLVRPEHRPGRWSEP